MTQEERLDYMLKYLYQEKNCYTPTDSDSKRKQLRSLMNLRMPRPIPRSFLDMQDDYLQQELKEEKIVTLDELDKIDDNTYLYQGDITLLSVDAIVNAANSALLGCFLPCHNCIDNIIHSKAGIELRLECDRIMKEQGYPEPTGRAKITKSYNLPSKYIIHTVGPIIESYPSENDKELLASCYRSSLELASLYNLKSIAFCCISTGVFSFPNEPAARIAIKTVNDYLNDTKSDIKVVFNVFKDIDKEIYERLLKKNKDSKRRDQ